MVFNFGRETMLMKFFNLLILLALLIALAAPALATAHTSYGNVADGDSNTRFKFYIASEPTRISNGAALTLIGANYRWTLDAGAPAVNFVNPTDVGKDSVAIIWREDNRGTINHKGYYAVMNENLLGSTPQAYNTSALREISIPATSVSGTTVTISWTAMPLSPDASENPNSGNVIGYYVYRSTDGINYGTSPINSAMIANPGTGQVTYSDTSRPAGTYYYAIEPVFIGNVRLGDSTQTAPILSLNSNQATVIPAATIAIDPSTVDEGWQDVVMTISGANTHFDGTTTVTFTPAGSATLPDPNIVGQVITLGGVDFADGFTGPVTVTVTTGGEIVTTTFTVNAVADPDVAVAPSSLTFNFTIGGAAPAAQTVTVTDANSTGALNWTASESLAWLNITASGAGDGDTLSVSVTTDQPADNYSGNITVTDAAGDSVTIPVTYNVTEAGNHNPTAPTLTAPANGAVGVSNTPAFEWNPSTDADGDTVTYTLTVTGAGGATNYPSVTSPYTLATALADGAYTWSVAANDGRGGSAASSTFGFTAGAITEVVIDDFSGAEVNAGADATWGNGDDSYYPFSENDTANPIMAQQSGSAPNGTHYLGIALPAVPAPESDKGYSWRGYSATLSTPADISAFANIKFSLKGDGVSDALLKLQLTDGANHIVAVADSDTTHLPNMLTATWQEVSIPVSALVPTAASAPGAFDYTDVVSYQFVFTGLTASAGHPTPAIAIDYLRADDSTTPPPPPSGPTITSISPSPASPGDTITIKGENLGTGGKVEFDSDAGTFTTKGDSSTITAWSANEITMTLPTLSAGEQEVKVVTDANEESNTVILEVVSTKSGEGPNYNYPNPFNVVGGEETTIVFPLPTGASNINVYIFDTTARQVYKGAWDSATAVGEITWNGRNYMGEVVGDGVYLYRVVNEADKSIIGKGKILVINR